MRNLNAFQIDPGRINEDCFHADTTLGINDGDIQIHQSYEGIENQYSMLVNFILALPENTIFHLQTGDGDDVLSFLPAKNYQSIAFSSHGLMKGKHYSIYYGGSCSGEANDGLYKGGIYSPGTKYSNFTVSSIVTRVTSR